jgi:hypothetical protein
VLNLPRAVRDILGGSQYSVQEAVMFQAIASRTLGLVAALAAVLAAPPAVYAGNSGSTVPRTGKPSLTVKFDIGGPNSHSAGAGGRLVAPHVPRPNKPSLIVKFDIGGPTGSAAPGQGQQPLMKSGALLEGGGTDLTRGGPAAAGALMAAPAATVRVIK